MIQIKVRGLICRGCIKSIYNSLKSIDPLAEVFIDLESQIVQVESPRSVYDLIKGIEEVGFNVEEVQRLA